MTKEYALQTFTLDGYTGLNKDMLEEHYGLYKGYVTNINKITAQLEQMIKDGKADTPEASEIRRRFGFEMNGVRLHEYYFGGMKPGGSPEESAFKSAIAAVWGSVEVWQQDFVRTGMMRGIGWAVLYQDTSTGALQNFWIGDHENGHPAGFKPVLVMDVWEHAYVKQYGAAGRKTYIETFFKNIDWKTVAARLK
jgi:Fe-Mn family superoxide dismutase